jgi:hypothetical protein
VPKPPTSEQRPLRAKQVRIDRWEVRDRLVRDPVVVTFDGATQTYTCSFCGSPASCGHVRAAVTHRRWAEELAAQERQAEEARLDRSRGNGLAVSRR